MRQLVQDMSSGAVRVREVPAPLLRPGGVLVRTHVSVISIGTERMRLEFVTKSLLGKALERPDQVRKVLETAAREGIVSAYRKARSRLSGLSPLGYCCAGVIESVGDGVNALAAGTRVACAGGGYANHAERVWVPQNLVVPVPDEVPLEHAAFTTLGAIALHGVRQAGPSLGESVVVLGLGLVGQLTLRLLRAAGTKPLGVDVVVERVAFAAQRGTAAWLRSDDVVAHVRSLTDGRGADAVIITAATSSDDPVRLAGELARDRARVVVVGAVPIRVPRVLYYGKELELRLSRSYGPGRYDVEYEEKGSDYPIGYVRWTERRNMAEFVRLLASGAVAIDDLITHRFAIAQAEQAYELLSSDAAHSALGVLIQYPVDTAAEPRRIPLRAAPPVRARGARIRVGVIGAGNFATGTLLPILRKLDVELVGVATASGLSALSAGETFGFRYVAASADELLADPEIDLVLIATRHDEHARLAAAALRAGKAVFVEKPLALDEESLEDVLRAAATGGPLLVGFNRRFAPATQFIRERLERCAGPRMVHLRVNAGALPSDSWVYDPKLGGGRLIGEGCHFIDLGMYLAGSVPVEVLATAIGGAEQEARRGENVQVVIRCTDGSLVTLLYTAKGHQRSGKERVEVFAGGASGVIDDFQRAEFWGARRDRWRGRQDKGHARELDALLRCVRAGGGWPIPLEEITASSRATLAAARTLPSGIPKRLD